VNQAGPEQVHEARNGDGEGRQGDQARPAELHPGRGQHGDRGGEQRVADGEPEQPPGEPDELHRPDHEVGSLVDGRPPDGNSERVGVVDLGEWLTCHLPLERGRHRIKSSSSQERNRGGRRCELQPPRL
jgi:hypothetical protein